MRLLNQLKRKLLRKLIVKLDTQFLSWRGSEVGRWNNKITQSC